MLILKGFPLFIYQSAVASNFLALLLGHLPDFSDFYQLIGELLKVRTILRRKYIEFVDRKNGINYRKIDNEEIINELERRVAEFKNGFRGISSSDKRIMVYFDYMSVPNPYSGFLTFDKPILDKRRECMKKLHNGYLNIINPTECLYLLSKAPEYESLITEICLNCCKVINSSANGNLCDDCQSNLN